MANKTLSQQTEATSLASGDLVAITDISDTTDSASGTSKKTLLSTITTYIASLTQTLTNKTIALGSNTVSGTKANFNTAVTDGNIVYENDSVTLLYTNTSKILGRTSASSGAVEELTVGTGLTLTTGQLSATSTRCRVYQTGATGLSTTWTALAFGAENFDTDVMHDNSTDNTRITFNTAGTYVVGGIVGTTSNAVVGARVRLNGSTILATQRQGNSGANESANVSTIYTFAQNDYIELQGYAGSSVNSFGDSQCSFWAYLIP